MGWLIVLPEKRFETLIKQYFNAKGAWVLKTFSDGIQRSGVPDLLICYKGKFIGIEVKATKGHPSDLQLWNVREIRKAGGVAVVLYPDQWEDFKIMVEYQMWDIQKKFDRKELE